MTVKKNKPLPEWFTNEIAIPFRAGIARMFLLYGDINGLVANPEREREPGKPYITVRQLLGKVFAERPLAISYAIDSGLLFPTKTMEEEFRSAADLNEADSSAGSDPNDPVAAAKADLAKQRPLPKEPEVALRYVGRALRKLDQVAVIIQGADFIAPATTVGVVPQNERVTIQRLLGWAQNPEYGRSGNVVILLADQAAKVSERLRQEDSGIAVVAIPKPSQEERREFIATLTQGSLERRALLAKRDALSAKSRKTAGDRERLAEAEEELGRLPVEFAVPDDFDLDAFAQASRGLSLRQIREVFLRAQQDGAPVDLQYVKAKKREILNKEYGDVMKIVDPQCGLDDIGGLAHIKQHLRSILNAIKRGEANRVPMGLMLMGPPGTGKTALAEATAKESDFEFIEAKNIRYMYVGMSEIRMERFKSGTLALAPVVVMNDEADLKEASRDAPKGDSGVSERLMGEWMTFLSDPKIQGKVLVFSCTNRPDRIDPALKRSGRTDARILVPMPSTEELREIFAVMFRFLKVPTTIEDFTPFAEMTQGRSGADVKAIVQKADAFAGEKGLASVDAETLKEAVDDTIPSASQREIDFMTMVALLESSSRRLLPPHVREIVEGIRQRNLVEGLDEMLRQLHDRNIVKIDDLDPE